VERPLASICIPSYDRPKTLERLLRSIDVSDPSGLEIVICEDNSTHRPEIRTTVNRFLVTSELNVRYFENRENIGYDRNLRELIGKSAGDFVIFMGDDDTFVPGQLDPYLQFLRTNSELGYVLRPFRRIHRDGQIEMFRYFISTQFFRPGTESYVKLFRKSVFISGYTFRREYSTPFLSSDFDGTLLYQLYLLAELTLKYPSAFCDIVLTQQVPGDTKPMFGHAEAEKALYTPGQISVDNSVHFMQGFLRISQYIDSKYGIESSSRIRTDISKYSYSVLAIQRDKGIVVFIKYVLMLNQQVGINITFYYYIYVALLMIFGRSLCDLLVTRVKSHLGRTPYL
jgi:abequosyltransferase